MKLHGNARTCPKSRKLLVERIVEQGWSLTEAAAAAGVSDRTARKWVARFRAEGEAGLLDRSSAPKRIPHRTPVERVESIEALRKLRMTAAEIAEALGTLPAYLTHYNYSRRHGSLGHRAPATRLNNLIGNYS